MLKLHLLILVEDNSGTLVLEREAHFLHPGQGLPHGWMVVGLDVKHQEPPAPGPEELASQRAFTPSRSVSVVHQRIGDRRGKALFELPAFIQQLTEVG